jgi:inosine-uridine nucleoside N-ribohydrolase
MVLSLDIEKYLIPINVCRQVVFTSKDFDNLENNTLSKSIKKITKQYIDYYSSNKEY